MVGKYIEFQEGKGFTMALAALATGITKPGQTAGVKEVQEGTAAKIAVTVAELREAIHRRRTHESGEEVEVRPGLFVDSVMFGGHNVKFLFAKPKAALIGKLALLDLAVDGQFPEDKLERYATAIPRGKQPKPGKQR